MTTFPFGFELEPTLYPPTSRYHGVAIVKVELNGQTTACLARRLLPRLDRFELVREHRVTQGDRLDNLAFVYLGDAEQFWRICDANPVLNPPDLTNTPGERILITLPEGVRTASHA